MCKNLDGENLANFGQSSILPNSRGIKFPSIPYIYVCVCVCVCVLVKPHREWDILDITQGQGKAEAEC